MNTLIETKKKIKRKKQELLTKVRVEIILDMRGGHYKELVNQPYLAHKYKFAQRPIHFGSLSLNISHHYVGLPFIYRHE